MTKTKISMKWLVLALLVVVIAGAIALSLSLNAKATGEKYQLHVFIGPSTQNTRANTIAHNNGWVADGDTIPTASDGNAAGAGTCWHFSNFATFTSYGLRADTTNANYTSGNLRKYIDEHPGEVDPEIDIHVISSPLN